MVLSGYLRFSVVIYGYLWFSVVSMVLSGYVMVKMDPPKLVPPGTNFLINKDPPELILLQNMDSR